MTSKTSLDFANRPVKYPDLKVGTWVRLLPKELGDGALIGRILFQGSDTGNYPVLIPYEGDGALIYVHKADVEPSAGPDQGETAS